MIDYLLGAAACAGVWALWGWWKTRRDAQKYRDGLFHLIAILDLPIEEWERRYRRDMSEAEWFGFQRGYQQACVDALRLMDYQMQIHIHSNRLQRTPDQEESLGDMAERP